MLNKQIHLIGPKNKNEWKPVWKHCFNYWENSSYNIMLWTDEDIDAYLKKDDLHFFNQLNQLPRIYKYDYIRYVILRDIGGAYFDLDVEIVRDFLPLLDPNSVYLLGGGLLDSHVSNAINLHLEFFLTLSLEAVLHITGPDAISKYIALSRTHINVLSNLHFGDTGSNLTFSKHHLTNNWHKFKH